MSPDLGLNACADLVARADPDRFAALMAAPVTARAKLLPLFAMNIEVSRAPWASKEPMICEMRLQWWRDIVDAPLRRAHEIAGPVQDLIQSADLPIPVLDRMISARIWDIYTDPFADQAALIQYLRDTSGGLMWLSALALGADPAQEPLYQNAGLAMGIANYLRAVPQLEQRGRRPLIDGRPSAVAELAQFGLDQLPRGGFGAAWPAVLPAAHARAYLAQVVRNPQIVARDAMALAPFFQTWSRLRTALTHRI